VGPRVGLVLVKYFLKETASRRRRRRHHHLHDLNPTGPFRLLNLVHQSLYWLFKIYSLWMVLPSLFSYLTVLKSL
jgi:hypothetical protein